MHIDSPNNLSKHQQPLRGLLFGVAVFFIALILRGYHLADIQPHHDEAPLFGFNRSTPLRWTGSIDEFLCALFRNADQITEGDSPPMACLVAELFRFIAGENLVAARWFHAVIQALGVALIAWLAWRIYWPVWPPILAVALLATFSVVSIYFGQFGEMYAIYFLAAVVQYLGYWLILRGRYTWCRYVVFIILAFICTLFEYLQVFITVALLLTSVLEKNRLRRSHRLLRALSAFLVYAVLNTFPFFYFMTKDTLRAGFRPYLWIYYPGRCLEVHGWSAIVEWIKYYVVMTYDLFDYHISLVFNQHFYQPLQWNWFSLPFILTAIVAVTIVIWKGRRKSNGIVLALVCTLVIYIVGNRFFLLPYGGVRNSLFIAPIIWLGYGEIVAQFRRGFEHRLLRVTLEMVLIILPLYPFLFSLSNFYRDRISRVDLNKLGDLIVKYKPDTLIMAEATYWPFLMILQRHPEFKARYFEQAGVKVTSFFECDDSRWGHYPLPVPGKNVLAMDFYQSFDGRLEGTGITNDHPTLKKLAGPDWVIEPLVEKPGKYIKIRQHQSIYYPPNSFFIYRLRRTAGK